MGRRRYDLIKKLLAFRNCKVKFLKCIGSLSFIFEILIAEPNDADDMESCANINGDNGKKHRSLVNN